jgi:hypothetical protein
VTKVLGWPSSDLHLKNWTPEKRGLHLKQKVKIKMAKKKYSKDFKFEALALADQVGGEAFRAHGT